jgi:hypothetical protein
LGAEVYTMQSTNAKSKGDQMTVKLLSFTVGAAVAAALMIAGPAAAAPSNKGAACTQAGISTLKTLGLFRAAAHKEIDYSTLADPQNGPIFADLPTGSFLSLGQVIRLHHTNPELFAWCR